MPWEGVKLDKPDHDAEDGWPTRMPWEGVKLDKPDHDAEDGWPTEEPTARSRSSGRSQKDCGTVWCEAVHDRGPEVLFPIPHSRPR